MPSTDIDTNIAAVLSTSYAGGRHNMPPPLQVDLDLLTLKLVSESRVTWATSVPLLIFLGLYILDLGPMYATNRQTSDAHHHLMPPTLGAGAWYIIIN